MLSLKCIFIQYEYKWPRAVKWETQVTEDHQNSQHQLYPPTWLHLKFRFIFLLTMWVRLDSTPSPTWQARQPVQSIVIYPKRGFPWQRRLLLPAPPMPAPAEGVALSTFHRLQPETPVGTGAGSSGQEPKKSSQAKPYLSAYKTKLSASWRKGERTWQGDSAVTWNFFTTYLAKWGKTVNFLSRWKLHPWGTDTQERDSEHT